MTTAISPIEILTEIRVPVSSLCRTPWNGNIPTREKSGDGNGCFPQAATTPIGQPESSADMISMNPFYRRL